MSRLKSTSAIEMARDKRSSSFMDPSLAADRSSEDAVGGALCFFFLFGILGAIGLS